jgi:hypothetical protein
MAERSELPKDLLDWPLYEMSQVDDLIRLPNGTARRWIEGYTRGSRFYPPVIADHPLGTELVTWGEFVEVQLMAR